MNPRVASFLHLYPPQRQHILSNQTQVSHPVCLEVTDYCFKIDKQHPTQIPISQVRLPVIAPIPANMDRFVFDEVIADNGLFSNLHNPKTVQEIELLPPKNTLDNVACDVVAGAHHGACKLLISYGAVGSGHGLLAHGCSVGQVPSTGLLWSILDSVGADADWPRVACFTVERDKIRDLLSTNANGTLFKPKTKAGVITVETFQENDMTFLPLNYTTKQKLTAALHQKRRALATWHAISTIVDRSEQTTCFKLKNIYSQVGLNNYQVALDVCYTTCTLILLGPERDYSHILLVDLPAYAHQSTIAEYRAGLEMADVQRQSAAIKNVIKFGKKDHNIARLIMGCVPTLFVKSAQRDLYVFSSVQVSDFDRQQTHSVLKLASAFDIYIEKRFFEAYKANERRERLSGAQFTTFIKSENQPEFDSEDQVFDQQNKNTNFGIGNTNFEQSKSFSNAAHNINIDQTNNFMVSPQVIKNQFNNSIRAQQLLDSEDFEEKKNVQLSTATKSVKLNKWHILTNNSIGLTQQEESQQQQKSELYDQQLQQLQQIQQLQKRDVVDSQNRQNQITTQQLADSQNATFQQKKNYDFQKYATDFDNQQNVRGLLTKMKMFLDRIE